MGNLCVLLLLLAYRREDSEPALRDHITAQLWMTLAFPFAAARLFSDFPLFPILNSSSMILGVYHEVRALAGLSGFDGDRPKRHLLWSLLAALAVYVPTAIYTANMVTRVIALSISMFILMLPITFIILRKKDNSRIRIIIGCYLAVLMMAYLFRIFDAVRLGGKFVIFGQSMGESFMLASLYLYQILGGVGVLLMSKEKEDARLVKLAFYDEATGALNHTGTVEKIGGALERCSTENKSFLAAITDIDTIGALNRRLGIETGDKIIAKFARKLLDVVDGEGMVGRLAGDELFVFIPGADISRAEILAKKMVGIPAEDFVGEARYTISAGVVVYENPAGRRLDIDSVRASCSEALIEAKRNGPGSKVVLSR